MPKPPCEVADIVRAHGRQFIESHRHQLQAGHLRVLQSIENCRTAVLGGHLDACDRCGHRVISYNSCRNRHCPKCQGAARQKWLDRQSSDLLPVPYFHVVFTLPQQLAPVALQNKSAVYGILFRAASETLLEVAADPKHLGAQLGLLAVLHTWGQALQHHPHLHCVVPGGGLSPDRTQWIPSGGGRFLVPVQVLSRVFRGKFLAFLTAAYRQGKLQFHGRLTSLRQPSAFDQLRRQAYAREWVVYAKRPFAGPEQVLGYLARYTHRVAISNSRILSLDGAHVAFRWKDYACHNKKRKMTITAEEFLRRFLLHVLPKGFVRIRAFGFLANRHRSALLALCRQHLSVFPTIPVSSIVVPATIVPPLCPQCRTGHMQLVERMPSQLRYFRFHDTS